MAAVSKNTRRRRNAGFSIATTSSARRPRFRKERSRSRKNRIARARKDYRYFVRTYFPHLATTECADFQVDAAAYMRDHENARSLFEWARGHAKSTHISLLQPLWLKIQPNAQPLIMILVSKARKPPGACWATCRRSWSPTTSITQISAINGVREYGQTASSRRPQAICSSRWDADSRREASKARAAPQLYRGGRHRRRRAGAQSPTRGRSGGLAADGPARNDGDGARTLGRRRQPDRPHVGHRHPGG